MKKETWKVHTIAICEDCGRVFDNYKNGQALAAQHAKKYKHVVHGEVRLAFKYDGRDSLPEL
jgi:Fe2+ or Zn2+ uptake regulation protein